MKALEMHRVPLKCFRNLDCELASGYQHERLRGLLEPEVVIEPCMQVSKSY